MALEILTIDDTGFSLELSATNLSDPSFKWVPTNDDIEHPDFNFDTDSITVDTSNLVGYLSSSLGPWTSSVVFNSCSSVQVNINPKPDYIKIDLADSSFSRYMVLSSCTAIYGTVSSYDVLYIEPRNLNIQTIKYLAPNIIQLSGVLQSPIDLTLVNLDAAFDCVWRDNGLLSGSKTFGIGYNVGTESGDIISVSAYAPTETTLFNTIELSIDNESRFAPISTSLTFNPDTISIKEDGLTNQQAELRAIYNIGSFYDVPDNTSLIWRTSPSAGIIDKNYAYQAQDTNGWTAPAIASQIGSISALATDLSEPYTIYLSADNGSTDSYSFWPYSNTNSNTQTNIRITPVETLQQEKQYIAHVFGNTAGVEHNFQETTKVQWDKYINDISDLVQSTGPFVAEKSNFGSEDYYDWSAGYKSVKNVTPLYLSIDAGATTTTPNVCAFTLGVSAVSATSLVTQSKHICSVTISATEFIDEANLAAHFQIWHESTRDITDMWRQGSTYTNVTISADPTFSGLNFLSGYSVFDIDGETISTSVLGPTATMSAHITAGVNFNDANTTSVVTHYLSNVGVDFGTDGIYYFTVQKSINLHLVDLIPEAKLNVWPSYVWNGSTWSANISSLPSLTQGASAYGSGHTETFNISSLSAITNDNVTYRWTLSSAEYGQTITNVTNDNTSTYAAQSPAEQTSIITTPISLAIFVSGDGEVPSTMNQYHYNDNNEYVSYRNFTQTTNSNSNSLCQHIRMVPLGGDTGFDIIDIDPVYVPETGQIVTTVTTTDAAIEPITVNPDSMVIDWSLSGTNWSDATQTLFINNSGQVSFTLTIGDKTTTLKIADDMITPLVLSASATSYGTVIDAPADDWPQIKATNSDSINITAVPIRPKVYTKHLYALTGENIVFENATFNHDLVSDYVSAFIWNDSLHDDFTIESFVSYITNFDIEYEPNVTLSIVSTGDEIVNTHTFNVITNAVQLFKTFDPDIARVVTQTTVVLPFDKESCRVGPQEWAISKDINKSMEKLTSNLDYLKKVANIYSEPPTKLYGWYGDTTSDNIGDSWHVDIDYIDTDYNDLTNVIQSGLSAVNDIRVFNENIYISNNNMVQILSSDYEGTLIAETDGKSIADEFAEIVAIDVNEQGYIYVLDKPKNEVVILQYNENLANPWENFVYWGGLGGASIQYKFNAPTDLYYKTKLWVCDSGNNCLKRYSSGGAWEATITADEFDVSAPISLTIDSSDYVHVLLANGTIVNLTQSGTVLGTYDYPDAVNATPRKIRPSNDGGFIYVVLEDKIVKFTRTGIYMGYFGDEITGSIDYYSLYHDDNRDVYIANGTSIVKYIDKVDIKTIILADNNYWDDDQVEIVKDEFIENWVYNKIFARMWDNIELYRRSILGKISNEGNVLSIEPFDFADLKQLPYNKNEIYIGINEIVAANVVNRCIDQLFECEKTVLELIS